jgi:formiminoglutamase
LRLGELLETWNGELAAIRYGRPILIGFPQDEGVRRNGGRPGAAQAPAEIRRWLYRLVPGDGSTGTSLRALPPLDLGDVKVDGSMEESQAHLSKIVVSCLERGAVPIVLGGGHETAFGHYLAYAQARQGVGIINIDAHLDVRPVPAAGGHSGTPFRQAIEHQSWPLPGNQYVCLGAQPFATSQDHLAFTRAIGSIVRWRQEIGSNLAGALIAEYDRLAALGCAIYVSLDADVVSAADVPGVSAPNPDGIPAAEILACLRQVGRLTGVASFDLVEISPPFDRNGQSARWAALAVWNFMMGLAERSAK